MKYKNNGEWVQLPMGTTVEANPTVTSQSPALNSIKIGRQVYKIDKSDKMDVLNPRGYGNFAMNTVDDSTLGRAATALGGYAVSAYIQGYTNCSISFVSYDSVLDETIYTITNKSDISNLLPYLDEDLYIVFEIGHEADVVSIDTSNRRITVKGSHLGYTQFYELRYYSFDPNTASGDGSLAEGAFTTASGDYSHSEGYSSEASGYISHAEGYNSEASGDHSHAEGVYTIASGENSHAEGWYTTASGSASHAEGDGTIAHAPASHVEGKYNIEDTQNKYAHIIGNGMTDGTRSNAMTVDWNGKVEAASDVVANKGKSNEVSLSQINTDLTKLVPTLLYKNWGEGGQPTSITLSQPYTNFDMLIVSFKTNIDFVTKLVDVEGFSNLSNYLLEVIIQDASLFARSALKKTSNPTVFNLEYYQSNVNWALHPTKIVGIKFLQ